MRNVFLVGMPSSGKSTLGRELSRRLDYGFLDLDDVIEADQRCSISEIFRVHGESYFRTVEANLLRKVPLDAALVVATGGGTPCFQENMEFIRRNGVSVFLDIKPEVLAARINEHAKDDRPLLSAVEDLETELRQKSAFRRKYYQQSDLQVDETTGAGDLAEALRPFLY